MNHKAAQPANAAAHEPIIGLASLMTMAFSGQDLSPLGAQMIARAGAAPDDANALMDLSTILLLRGNKSVGLAAQEQALAVSRFYCGMASNNPSALRILALMAPGDLMTNTPLDFLLKDADVTLEMLYLIPGQPFPVPFPEHDVLFVAIGESDANRTLLQQLDAFLRDWHGPVCNVPGRVGNCARETAHTLLSSVSGICMPVSARVSRESLEQLCSGKAELNSILEDGVFPLIIRPLGSHAGHGLVKVDSPDAMNAYLREMPDAEFHISRFIDYRSADGLFRKYRVVLIGGRAFAGHMGISDHWMIHYLNAGMAESAGKRAEEERFMTGFDEGFARRHAVAIGAIAGRVGLDYLVMDCGETPGGDLLVFEIDPGAVVHAMDPAELFPYKHAQMQKVFSAFLAMLSGLAAPAAQR